MHFLNYIFKNSFYRAPCEARIQANSIETKSRRILFTWLQLIDFFFFKIDAKPSQAYDDTLRQVSSFGDTGSLPPLLRPSSRIQSSVAMFIRKMLKFGRIETWLLLYVQPLFCIWKPSYSKFKLIVEYTWKVLYSNTVTPFLRVCSFNPKCECCNGCDTRVELKTS